MQEGSFKLFECNFLWVLCRPPSAFSIFILFSFVGVDYDMCRS